MSKIRVHELAKELNKSSKDIIYALKGHGVLVESHMSTIGEENADKIRKYFTAPPVKKPEAPKAAAPKTAAPEKAPVRTAPAQNEHRPNNGGQNRQGGNGERRPFNNGQNRQGGNGERRPFNNGGQNRQGGNGERRPFNNGQNRQGGNGERRPFNNGGQNRQGGNGERRPFNNGGQNRQGGNGERRPFNNGGQNRQGGSGERRPFNNGGQNRQGGSGERRPYNNNGGQNRQGGYNNNRGGRGEGKFNLDNAISKEVVVSKDTSRENRRNYKDKEKPVKSVTDGRNSKKGFGGKPLSKKSNLQPPTQKPKPVVEKVTNIILPEVVTIKELGDKMKISAAEIVKKLFLGGKMVTLNTEITYDEAEEIALEYDVLCEHEVVIDPIEEILKEEEEKEGEGKVALTRPQKRHPLQTCSTVRFECLFILISLVNYRSKINPYYSLDNFLVCHFHNRKFTIIIALLPLLSPLLFLPTLSSLLLFFVPYICGYLLAFSPVFPAF